MNVQHKVSRFSGRAHSHWQTIAGILLCLAILSFLSPQVGQLGRGLQTTLPALLVAAIAINQTSRWAFIRAFVRFRSAFLLGFIFLTQAALRFAYSDDAGNLWHTWILEPVMCLAFLLWVGAYAELGKNAVRLFKGWLFFGWCASLVLGLPALIENPGVARTTMGNQFAAENAAMWAPAGVGDYGIYTSLAICLVPLFSVAQGFKGVIRWLALILLFLSAGAVLLSTFTMASVLLVLSLFGLLLAWVGAARGWSRVWRATVALFVSASLLLLYSQVSQFSQTDRTAKKAERLFEGLSTTGLAKGDETGRGDMFVDEMKTFANEPFLGYIPHLTGKSGHGHSSLSNSLVLFGLFGAFLWVAVLWLVFKSCFRYADSSLERRALWFSWLILALGGILNPLWHITTALGALFALSVSSRKEVTVLNDHSRRKKHLESSSASRGDRGGYNVGS